MMTTMAALLPPALAMGKGVGSELRNPLASRWSAV